MEYKKITRITPDIVSAYNTLRISELMHGVNTGEPTERAEFIRSWVKHNGQSLTPEQSALFHQQIQVGTKTFMHRWLRMEKRMQSIKEYLKTTEGWNDKQKLEGALRDLDNAGYLVRYCDTSETEIRSKIDKRKLATYGLVAVHKAELGHMQDGWIEPGKHLVINALCNRPGPYLAAIDAFVMAGFGIVRQDKFKRADLLEMHISTTKGNEYTNLLKNLTLPEGTKPS